MKILFYGFQHGHIFGLYDLVKERSDVEIVACLEKEEKKRRELAENDGIVCDEKDYDFWLSQDVDIVAVGAKYGERGEAIIKALQAGKHVIADKPICTTRKQLETIVALTKEKNLKVACMLDLRYQNSTKTVKKLLSDGEFGEVKNVSFTGQHCLDYAHRPSWYFEDGMHGGTINDLAIHGIDLVLYLTGLKLKSINAARCWNSYAYKTPKFRDCAIFMAELENGAGLLADVSYSAPSQVFSMPTYWDFKLWCEKGLIHFNAVQSNVYLYKEGEERATVLLQEWEAGDYLTDLIHEIETNKTEMTESVLLATEQTLALQEF
jgi:predicted dehydrogenase